MDPRKLKVNELKEQLQLSGLSVNGKKEELVARLLEHQKAEEEAALAAGPPTGTGESFNWEDPIEYVNLHGCRVRRRGRRDASLVFYGASQLPLRYSSNQSLVLLCSFMSTLVVI